MSRILLKSVAVLGLSLASCSMPFMDDDSSSSFEARETTPVHKGGLAETHDGFSKYFLNHDPNTPYSYSQGGIFDSLLSVFSFEDDSFGAATRPRPVYAAPYDPGRRNGEGLGKLVFDRDSSDPYQQ